MSKGRVVMRQHNIWCVYVSSIWRSKHVVGVRVQIEHTYTYHTLCCRITTPTFYILSKF